MRSFNRFLSALVRVVQAIGASSRKFREGATGKILLTKINIDENPELAQPFRVQSIPTVIAFTKANPSQGSKAYVRKARLIL